MEVLHKNLLFAAFFAFVGDPDSYRDPQQSKLIFIRGMNTIRQNGSVTQNHQYLFHKTLPKNIYNLRGTLPKPIFSARGCYVCSLITAGVHKSTLRRFVPKTGIAILARVCSVGLRGWVLVPYFDSWLGTSWLPTLLTLHTRARSFLFATYSATEGACDQAEAVIVSQYFNAIQQLETQNGWFKCFILSTPYIAQGYY